MTVGANLKVLRQRAGLTQKQLADASGMQLTQISRIENNDTDPKASTLIKIMAALKCSADDLFNAPSESSQVPLEEFIDSIDIRAGIEMKTVVLLWRYLDNHKEFLSKLQSVYKDDPHPHAELIKRMTAES
jgi:transcriptional regulator with XRE-family HTH domain